MLNQHNLEIYNHRIDNRLQMNNNHLPAMQQCIVKDDYHFLNYFVDVFGTHYFTFLDALV